MSTAHAAALILLRRAVRPYHSSPLPNWERFAAATRWESFRQRTPIPSGDADILVLLRGVLKLVNREPGHPMEGQVEEFFEATSMVVPSLRPRWAAGTAAPLSIAGWRSRRWAVPRMEAITVTPCRVLRIDYRMVELLSSRHPAWGEISTAFLWTYVEGLFAASSPREDKDATQRYQDLLAGRGQLVRKVSQRDLASYLGITESAMSRIARRVHAGQ